MRNPMIYLMVALIIFTSTAQAQIGDWQAVEDIPSGTIILVQAEGRVARCLYEGATDRELFCEQVHRSPYLQPREITFDRSEVVRVKSECTQEGPSGKGALIGITIGATVGAAVGENQPARDRLISGMVVGGIGGMFGSIIGRGFRTHTKVIYQK